MPGWMPSREWQCKCCTPARQIYSRARARNLPDVYYHEDDHTAAVPAKREEPHEFTNIVISDVVFYSGSRQRGGQWDY
jgi:hypothetical protein